MPTTCSASVLRDQQRLEDGNHRVEGLRQAGKDQTWAIIAFENPEERDDFVVPDPS